jgi:hypothetical protein
MKKTIAPAKLMLKLETVKVLKPGELVLAVGGLTLGCAHPTTITLNSRTC